MLVKGRNWASKLLVKGRKWASKLLVKGRNWASKFRKVSVRPSFGLLAQTPWSEYRR